MQAHGVTTLFGTTSYEYDLLDRIVRVVDRNGYATTYEYDANGNRTAVHYANGYTTTYEYDLLNRLIRQETIDSDTNVVVQYIYTLGAAGERLKVTELDRTVEYTYDSLYRLTSETITESDKTTSYTYAYDSVSNRTLKTENGTETEYVYNSLNQLISDSETSYEYDLNGNLVRVIGSAHSALYEYNCENKLVKATVQNGSLVVEESYTYDYAGNRTSKTTRTSDGRVEYVKYLNDNSSLTNVLAEIDSEGDVSVYYTIGADLISQEIDGKTYTYVYDGHGSVTALSDESGKITDTYSYDAFGNLLKSTGSTANNYRYCGEQFDGTTELYYLRARYMDTSTGRFISQDSYAGSIDDPTSLHKYLYANSNPVMYSDPSGYMGLLTEIAVSALIDVAVHGLISGAINIGLSIIHELRGTEPGETIDFVSVILTSFTEGFLTGAFFGACGMLASSLSSTAIFCALGGSSVLFSLITFGAAIAAGKAGDEELAAVNVILGIIGLVEAYNCFNNAVSISSAKNTASSATDASTENTSTATDSSGNSSSNTSLNFGDNDLVYGPTAGGKLKEFAEKNGGKRLVDFDKPTEMTWNEFTMEKMENCVNNGNTIHFDLTNMNDVSGVLNGTAYTNNTTSYELNYIRNNWCRYSNNVKFYLNGEEVNPPWID